MNPDRIRLKQVISAVASILLFVSGVRKLRKILFLDQNKIENVIGEAVLSVKWDVSGSYGFQRIFNKDPALDQHLGLNFIILTQFKLQLKIIKIICYRRFGIQKQSSTIRLGN